MNLGDLGDVKSRSLYGGIKYISTRQLNVEVLDTEVKKFSSTKYAEKKNSSQNVGYVSRKQGHKIFHCITKSVFGNQIHRKGSSLKIAHS